MDDLTKPIAGESGEDDFQDAAQAIMDGITELIGLQQQQLQLSWPKYQN